MNRTIQKYKIAKERVATALMPHGSDIFTAKIYNGEIYIFALVDDGPAHMTRNFCVIPDGGPYPESVIMYLDTLLDGDKIWHVYMDATDIRQLFEHEENRKNNKS